MTIQEKIEQLKQKYTHKMDTIVSELYNELTIEISKLEKQVETEEKQSNARKSEINEQDYQILKDALTYMASMYGVSLSKIKCDLDEDEGTYFIEYSCNGYVVDKETYDTLERAKELTDWWE